MPNHVALLGDSIFDNRAYTGGQPDVAAHLRSMLPPGWKTSLYARDGAATADFVAQISSVAYDATHLVISLGGNDAISNSDLLDTPVSSTQDALALFAERAAAFEERYRAALDAALGLGREAIVCTIYNGDLDLSVARLARTALTIFNDAILRVAFEHRLSVIDLRFICTEPADYTNAIEPSGAGGRKIAQAIAAALGAFGQPARATRIIVG